MTPQKLAKSSKEVVAVILYLNSFIASDLTSAGLSPTQPLSVTFTYTIV